MAVSAVSSSTDSAYGLDFKSLLQIILQQLTYQDPLKPMDNFQFVSQLAQFSQLQQTQTLNTSITSLLAAQSSLQATDLLGRTVRFTTETATELGVLGVVESVTFSGNQPFLSIKVDGQTVSNVALSAVIQVQQGS